MRTARKFVNGWWMQVLRAGIVLSVVFLQACATAELRTVPDVQSFGIPDEEPVQPVNIADSGLRAAADGFLKT